jgi:Sigma-70, region 4
MRPQEIVEILLTSDEPVNIEALIEASVHLPNRSSRWIAAYREGERRAWKSTGLRQKGPALALAKKWEHEAKRKRAAQVALPRKPTIRVQPGSAQRDLGLMTQAEVAAILRISERTVRADEKRAFDKIRRHPALRDFWNEYLTGEVQESALPTRRWSELTRVEIAAVYALARTPEERQALRKLFALMQDGSQ